MTPFKEGDRVVPVVDERVPAASRGRVYVVRKVNPRNLRCDAEDGGRGINFPAELLLPATGENVRASAAPPAAVPFVHFAVGEVVTLTRGHRDWSDATPLVVIGGRGEKMNVTKLGGYGDRYLRVAPSGLVRRDLSWLAEALIDEEESDA